ncbi:MAG: hypothetical protein K6G12_06985 [Lachnospiraceae bacterium]|nr:hypothetical protein [Lachnospiraceae bacterium]
MTGKKIILGWLRIVFGLFVFSFGVHLTIFANIGLAPWDCLGIDLLLKDRYSIIKISQR